MDRREDAHPVLLRMERVAMRNALGLMLASVVAAVLIAGIWYWTSAPRADAALPPKTIAAKPPEAVHNVPKRPKERKAPRLGVTTSESTFRTSPMLSAGTKRDIRLSAWLNKSGTGRYARNADSSTSAGKSDITK